MSQPKSVLKTLLLSSVIAGALITQAAHAETAAVTIVNVRSEDGVYRPALRVVRGGTITLFRTDDPNAQNPLTVAILRNRALLRAWLADTIPSETDEPIEFVVEKTHRPSDRNKPVEEEQTEEDVAEEELPTDDDDDDLAPSPSPCGPSPCGPSPCGPSPCGPSPCGSPVYIPPISFCPPGAPCGVQIGQILQIPQVSIAEMSQEQRLQTYATL